MTTPDLKALRKAAEALLAALDADDRVKRGDYYHERKNLRAALPALARLEAEARRYRHLRSRIFVGEAQEIAHREDEDDEAYSSEVDAAMDAALQDTQP